MSTVSGSGAWPTSSRSCGVASTTPRWDEPATADGASKSRHRIAASEIRPSLGSNVMAETLDISTDDCIVERDGPVVIITMNRPEKKNALSPTMLVGLADAYSYVDDTDEVRPPILPPPGGTFSSAVH